MSLEIVPLFPLLSILRFIGRPTDFSPIFLVCKSWRDHFDCSDVNLWSSMALDYDISLASTTLRRTLRSTSDLRRAFFRSYYKKMREMHDKHEFLIVQAKIILHQNRDQPSKLVKLISSTFTSTNYFDPNYRCKTMEDNTLLTLACRNGQMKCMKLLVDRFNADVNIADIGGFTPLILCAYHGNFSGVLYLLSKAASLSAMGKLRSGLPLTAEHWAAIQGHGEIFRYLHALRRRTVRRYIPICNVKIETQLKMESNAKTERGKVTTETEIILAETGPTESMLTSIREATSDESVQPSSSRINSSSAPSAMSVEEPLDSLLPTFLLFADEYFDVVGDAGLPKLPGQVSSPIQSHNENKFQVTASSSHNVSVDNDELTVVASTSCDSNSAVVPSVASSGLIAPSVSSSSSSSNSSDNGGDVAASNPTQVTEDSTYCYCRKGFEGQMIGCDAADCPVEWFHYRCVGLQARPVAKWFCPPCGLRRVTSGNKDGDVIGATVGKGEDQQYCVCSRGYVGRMVGCDNPKCLVEWFHFECVNLTAEPTGHWECPACRGERFLQPTAFAPLDPSALGRPQGRKRGGVKRGRGALCQAAAAITTTSTTGASKRRTSSKSSGAFEKIAASSAAVGAGGNNAYVSYSPTPAGGVRGRSSSPVLPSPKSARFLSPERRQHSGQYSTSCEEQQSALSPSWQKSASVAKSSSARKSI